MIEHFLNKITIITFVNGFDLFLINIYFKLNILILVIQYAEIVTLTYYLILTDIWVTFTKFYYYVVSCMSIFVPFTIDIELRLEGMPIETIFLHIKKIPFAFRLREGSLKPLPY
jgi:hypothetical protein